MITEREVCALIAKLRAYDRGTDAAVIRTADLRAAADALEALLPEFYAWADARTGATDYLEHAVPNDGDIEHLLPVSAWDDCWAARRGEEVRTFATREEAEAWLEEGDDAV
ncbi:MAG: hypothetical protein QJR07_20045 [Acetobacteraceae bacterium]|nr:hypothetical protein [Acetobacteraceae bacterium]